MEMRRVLKAEREISLEKLLRYLWRKKVWIIAGALIIMIITVAAGYRIDYKRYQSQQNEMPELSEEQVEMLNKLKDKEKELEGWKAYNESLLYLTFDPFSVFTIVIDFEIKGDNLSVEDIANIKAMYYSYFKCGEMTENINVGEKLGKDYILDSNVLGFEDAGINSRFFSFTVWGANEEQAEWLSEQIEQKLSEYKSVIEQRVKNFELEKISGVMNSGMRSDIYYQQQNQRNIQISLEEECNSLRTSLQLDESDELIIADEVSKPSVSVLYITMGILAGIGIMMIGVALEYMLSRKVKDKGDIKQALGITCLGEINTRDAQNSIKTIVDNINLYREENGGDREIGIVTAMTDETILDTILEELKSDNYSWNRIGKVADDAEKELNLIKQRYVVMIEKENFSVFDQVVANVSTCKENDVTILGYVYVK